MALTPEEFHARALAFADDQRRLPLSRMTGWDVSPFEAEGLRTTPLRAPQVPEPPRADEDPATCVTCTDTAAVWQNERWRLKRIGGTGVPLILMLLPKAHHDLADLPDDLAAEWGVLVVHVSRAIESLEHVARAHHYRLGDGGAHLHEWFFARPEGQNQFFGSWLPVWDDLLPPYPDDVAQADAERVAEALRATFG